MASWKNYKEDWILFLEAGFIAVNQTDEDSAVKLFKAAEMLNPKNVMPKVGFGYLHLHKLELKQAVKMFEEVLEMEPKNDMARALLGISLSLGATSMAKGEKVLEETCKSHDPMIKQLSNTAIYFVDNFLKKSPGPAQGEKPGGKRPRNMTDPYQPRSDRPDRGAGTDYAGRPSVQPPTLVQGGGKPSNRICRGSCWRGSPGSRTCRTLLPAGIPASDPPYKPRALRSIHWLHRFPYSKTV